MSDSHIEKSLNFIRDKAAELKFEEWRTKEASRRKEQGRYGA